VQAHSIAVWLDFTIQVGNLNILSGEELLNCPGEGYGQCIQTMVVDVEEKDLDEIRSDVMVAKVMNS